MSGLTADELAIIMTGDISIDKSIFQGLARGTIPVPKN